MKRYCAISVAICGLMAGCVTQWDWQAAKEAGTVSAYEQFMLLHPTSSEAADARRERDALLAKEAWDEATQADTLLAYQDCLKKCVSLNAPSHIKDAQGKISEIQGKINESIRAVKDRPWTNSENRTSSAILDMTDLLKDASDMSMVHEIAERALREFNVHVQSGAVVAITNQDMLVKYAMGACNVWIKMDAARRLDDAHRAVVAMGVYDNPPHMAILVVRGITDPHALTKIIESASAHPLVRSVASCKLSFQKQFAQRYPKSTLVVDGEITSQAYGDSPFSYASPTIYGASISFSAVDRDRGVIILRKTCESDFPHTITAHEIGVGGYYTKKTWIPPEIDKEVLMQAFENALDTYYGKSENSQTQR